MNLGFLVPLQPHSIIIKYFICIAKYLNAWILKFFVLL